MWVTTTQGFYSAVAHRTKPGVLLIRCRVKGDLDALKRQIPSLKPFRDGTADYPWRAEVSQADWMMAVARLAGEVDYDNFKNEVTRRQGKRRAGVYMRVWSALTQLERDFQRRYYGYRWEETSDDWARYLEQKYGPDEPRDVISEEQEDLFQDIMEPTLEQLARWERELEVEEEQASRSVRRSRGKRSRKAR